MAKTVSVVGSKNREYFEANSTINNELEVNVYDLKDGEKRDKPYYSRKFSANETKEIRLYGLSGRDIYKIDGDARKSITIRIIGGDNIDSINTSGHGKKVHVYDDNKNIFDLHSRTRLHLSPDSLVHAFNYDDFLPEKKGIKPAFGYNDEDRLFVGLGYTWQHQAFRKFPFAFKQTIGVNYSISQKDFSTTYAGLFPKAVGGWDLLLNANYDAVRWTYFFGLGNETPFFPDDKKYFRLRTAEWLANAGLSRVFGAGSISISGFYNGVRILLDSGKFITKDYLSTHPENSTTNNFAGGIINYNIMAVDDSIVPIKGITFNANARYIQNLSNGHNSFAHFAGDVEFFIPLVPTISLALNAGAATVTGTPKFYQYPAIGGGPNVRGFIRDRFRGKTVFYNSNELRFITNLRSHIMNGKAGLVAFLDNGRVWMPGESSSSWHTGYGGGILIAPFNFAFFDITYGISKESTQIQIRLRKKL
jgi:hypothetical protein